jgi:HEAT repeat protein
MFHENETMRAPFASRIEKFVRRLFGSRRRSEPFEAFRFSLLEGAHPSCDGLDTASLIKLVNRERKMAERMLIGALPDTRAVIGLGVLRSLRAEPRLRELFERECVAAQAAWIASDRCWRACALIPIAQALWRIAPQPRYARAIAGTLRCAPNWTERIYAAIALAEMPLPEVEDALIEALDDRDALVRHHAARALLTMHGHCFDQRAINHMVYRVMAEDPEQREAGRRDVIAATYGAPVQIVAFADSLRSLRPKGRAQPPFAGT